jgi:TatD DNase family protein
VEVGYYFSIPPSIVRSPQKQKLVRHLPFDRLLLESDAPVLGPDPSARNEPKNVRLACEAIAEIRGLSVEDVARATTENARRLFPRACS